MLAFSTNKYITYNKYKYTKKFGLVSPTPARIDARKQLSQRLGSKTVLYFSVLTGVSRYFVLLFLRMLGNMLWIGE